MMARSISGSNGNRVINSSILVIFYALYSFATPTQAKDLRTENREIYSGAAITVDSLDIYKIPDSNIRLLLINRDLYAMLSKFSDSKGGYVACPSVFNANNFAESTPKNANEWMKRNVAVDAVRKQATYVGFDCVVGNRAAVMPIVQKVALEARERALADEREAQARRNNEIELQKLEPLLGLYDGGQNPYDHKSDTRAEIHYLNGLTVNLKTSCCTLPFFKSTMSDDRTIISEQNGCRLEIKIEEFGRTVLANITATDKLQCVISDRSILLTKRP
ncbi:MAG: hypothetical protein ABIV04_13135 [Massilia sp.]